MNSDTGLFLGLFVWTPDVTSSFIHLQRTTKKTPLATLQTHHLEEDHCRKPLSLKDVCEGSMNDALWEV